MPGPHLVKGGHGGWEVTERWVEKGRKEGASRPPLTLPFPVTAEPLPPGFPVCSEDFIEVSTETQKHADNGKAPDPTPATTCSR